VSVSEVGLIAAIGEETAVAGYALAGAVVLPAEDPDAVLAAWNSLAADVEVVILTARAMRALEYARTADLHPLTVVIPS
jgi:vacuolar-type H+-ATPase subunit F/Vma7